MRKIGMMTSSTMRAMSFPFDGIYPKSICWNRSATSHRSISRTRRDFRIWSESWNRNRLYSGSWLEGRLLSGNLPR